MSENSDLPIEKAESTTRKYLTFEEFRDRSTHLPMTVEEWEGMPKEERRKVIDHMHPRINDPEQRGRMRDLIEHKYAVVLGEPALQAIAEDDVATISKFVSDCMLKYGTAPSYSLIAQETGFTWWRVKRVMDGYIGSTEEKSRETGLKMMKTAVMSKVYKQALAGDMKAARLFLQAIGEVDQPKPQKTVTNNNFLQVNKTILSQTIIQQLPEEKRLAIEAIITESLPLMNLDKVQQWDDTQQAQQRGSNA